MGMVKQLAKVTTFSIFVALIVMRSQVTEYYEMSKVVVSDFYTNNFTDQQQPSDITSLSKNSNLSDNANSNGVNFSKNKDLFLKEIVPRLSQIQARNQEKLAAKNAADRQSRSNNSNDNSNDNTDDNTDDNSNGNSNDNSINFALQEELANSEMDAIRMIAAKKFAELKAELDSQKDKGRLETHISQREQEIKNTSITNNGQTEQPQRQSQKEQISESKNVFAQVIVAEPTIAEPVTQPVISQAISPRQPLQQEVTLESKNNNVQLSDNRSQILATLEAQSDSRIPNSAIRKSRKVDAFSEDNEEIASLVATQDHEIISRNFLEDDEMVIIVNSNNIQSISFSDIKNMYNDKITSWPNGSKIKLYNLPIDSPTRKKFSNRILDQMPWEAAKAVSNRVVTNVLRNSMEIKTARLVVSTVSKNPNAIGYAPYKSVKGNDNLRIILPVN